MEVAQSTKTHFKVGLYDYVKKGEPIEIITFERVEGKKGVELCKEWMKNSYGGRIYVETYDDPKDSKKIIKMIFSEESDFFLMYKLLKTTK